MITMVYCTDVRFKRLGILTDHRREVDTFNKYLTYLQIFKEDRISSM